MHATAATRTAHGPVGGDAADASSGLITSGAEGTSWRIWRFSTSTTFNIEYVGGGALALYDLQGARTLSLFPSLVLGGAHIALRHFGNVAPTMIVKKFVHLASRITDCVNLKVVLLCSLYDV